MKYKKIPGINLEASLLVYGCAGDLMQEGRDNSEILDASFENGINFFDTARCYGESELSLGNWIKSRDIRHDVIVLTKGCHPLQNSLNVDRVNSDAIREDLDISLSKLKTDYIDIYLLHRDDVKVPVCEIVEALEAEKQKGKILSYGVSNWTLDRIVDAQEYAKEHGYSGFAISSPNYSLAEQVNDPWQSGSEAVSISGDAGKITREYMLKNNIPVVPYSSLARGLFSGKFKSSQAERAKEAMDIYAMRGFYSEANIEKLRRVEIMAEQKKASVSQIALAYLLSQKLQVHPVVSYSKKSHMTDNLGAINIMLDKNEIEFLERG